MKCLQKLYSSPSWLVVSLCLLCTLFLTMISTNSASAVSDLTVTYTAGTEVPAGTLYFPDCDDVCYSQYNYIIFNFSNPSANFSHSSTFNIRAIAKYNGSIRQLNITSEYSSMIFSLNSTKSLYGFRFNVNSSTILLTDLTVTLTDSLSFGDPVGSISITSNGTYDVTNYAEAVVDVPPEIVQGDYHDDLVNLKQAIILVPAVCLVIYFFYAIYKMIMGGVRR